MDLRNVFKGKRVLVTGHTGFKGVWLTLFLIELGAEVHGLGLKPENSPNLFELTKLENLVHSSNFIDIRNQINVENFLDQNEFDLIFHLAAQALVSEGYANPIQTFETNVMGTVNLLVSASEQLNLKGVVCVTTDKVYLNHDLSIKFKESDPIGGVEPYGGSKASSEIVASSLFYLFKNSGKSLVTCRAGNVIGGGDWSKDRLIPDAIRAITSNKYLQIRNPDSTRPWQHVLDCIFGYLLVGSGILDGTIQGLESFNFGPPNSSSVKELARQLETLLGLEYQVFPNASIGKEHVVLELDSSKARKILNWAPFFSSYEAINETADWYKAYLTGEDAHTLTKTAIERFMANEIN